MIRADDDDLDDDPDEDDEDFDEDDEADDDEEEDEEDDDVETWQVSEATLCSKGRSLLDFGEGNCLDWPRFDQLTQTLDILGRPRVPIGF